MNSHIWRLRLLALSRYRGGNYWCFVLPLYLFIYLITICASLHAEPIESNFVQRLQPVLPSSKLVKAAQARQIPLTQLDPVIALGHIDPGNSVTVLITLHQKKARCTQWLVYYQATNSGPHSASAKPTNSIVIFNTLGHRFEFQSREVEAALQAIGPFDVRPESARKYKMENAVFTLNEEFLGLGLDQAAALFQRISKSDLKRPFYCGTKPCSEAQIAEGRILANECKITPAEERASSGTYPALLSYFGIVQEIPCLKEILIKVIDRPSIWSLISHGGISSIDFNWISKGICPANPTTWGLAAEQKTYCVPMILKLNKHPTLQLTMVVTAPRSPLLMTGGIVAVLAEKPGDSDTWLTLHLLSARNCSGASPERR